MMGLLLLLSGNKHITGDNDDCQRVQRMMMARHRYAWAVGLPMCSEPFAQSLLCKVSYQSKNWGDNSNELSKWVFLPIDSDKLKHRSL